MINPACIEAPPDAPAPSNAFEGLELLTGSSPGERRRARTLFTPRKVKPGVTLIRQGADPSAFVIIRTGRARVLHHAASSNESLAVLDGETYVGEIGLLQHQPSGADVVAETTLEVFTCTPDAFHELNAVEAVSSQIQATADHRLGANWARHVSLVPVTMRDGTALGLRPLRPDDGFNLQRLGERMSSESLRLRFFTPVPPRGQRLQALLDLDHHSQVAIGAVTAGGELAGVARFARRSADPTTAELAITVADELHRRGIATMLLEVADTIAGQHGIDTLVADVLRENHAMLSLLHTAGAHLTVADAGMLRASLPVTANKDVGPYASLVRPA